MHVCLLSTGKLYHLAINSHSYELALLMVTREQRMVQRVWSVKIHLTGRREHLLFYFSSFLDQDLRWIDVMHLLPIILSTKKAASTVILNPVWNLIIFVPKFWTLSCLVNAYENLVVGISELSGAPQSSSWLHLSPVLYWAIPLRRTFILSLMIKVLMPTTIATRFM